ncbi:MAG: DoxX family membrane protein [Pseudonocardiales bacterium]|nr:DoxX family membrane protein [Pseudonocardiales bacterium]
MFSRVARPLLGAVAVADGVNTLLHPKPKIDSTAPLVANAPVNPALVVQAGAAVKIAAGLLMALGRAPRLAATLLAAELIPATVADQPFSSAASPGERKARQENFLANCGQLGGMLLAISAPAPKRRRKRRRG